MNGRRLSIIFFLITVIFILVIRSFLYIFPIASAGPDNEGDEEALFHVALVLDESNENTPALAQLITDEGKKYGVAVEVWYENDQTAGNRLKTVGYSGVDGLMLDAVFAPYLSEADSLEGAAKIVSLGNYDSQATSVVNVGYNAYDLGQKIGSMISGHLDLEEDREIILLHEMFEDSSSLSGSFQMGLKESLSELEMTLIKGDVREDYQHCESKTFILASSSSETVALVREISKQGKQDQCRVIGYGDQEDVRSYVDRGIIEGSIIYDNQELSEKAMDVMARLLEDKLVSETNHIAVKVYGVDHENR